MINKTIYEKNINNVDFNRINELNTPHVSLVEHDLLEKEYFYRDSEMFRSELDEE